MIFKFQYHSLTERNNIMSQNEDKFLIEEHNISDGCFLIFSDKSLEEKEIYVNIPKKDIEDIKNRTKSTEDALLAILTGGMM